MISLSQIRQRPPQPKAPEPPKVRKHGGGRGKPLSAEKLALVVRLYEAGETYVNIASKVGRSPKSIPKIVRTLNLPLRRG